MLYLYFLDFSELVPLDHLHFRAGKIPPRQASTKKAHRPLSSQLQEQDSPARRRSSSTTLSRGDSPPSSPCRRCSLSQCTWTRQRGYGSDHRRRCCLCKGSVLVHLAHICKVWLGNCDHTVSNVAFLDLLQHVGPDAGVNFLILCQVLRFEPHYLGEATGCLWHFALMFLKDLVYRLY